MKMPTNYCKKYIVHLLLISTLVFISSSLVFSTGLAEDQEWRPTLSLSLENASLSAVSNAGNLYILGGRNPSGNAVNTVYRHAVDGGVLLSTAWSATTNLGQNLYAGASVTAGKFIYMIGGWDDSKANITVYRNTINSDGPLGIWVQDDSLPTELQSHAAVVLNKRIYVVGGFNNFNPLSTVYYATIGDDGNLSSWQSATSLPHPLYRHSVVAKGNFIYTIGGFDGTTARTEVYRAEEVNGILSGWNKVTDLPGNRYYTRGIVRGHEFIIIGGTDGAIRLADVRTAQIDANGNLGPWEKTLPDLPEPRHRFAAVLGDLGQIYVLGGMDGNNQYRKDVYVLSPPPGLRCATSNSPIGELPPGATVTYTTQCTADRYLPLNGGITVTQQIAANLNFTGTLTGGDTQVKADKTITWTVNSLEPNQTVTFTYQAERPKESTNTPFIVVSNPAQANWLFTNPTDSKPESGSTQSNITINSPYNIFLPVVQR